MPNWKKNPYHIVSYRVFDTPVTSTKVAEPIAPVPIITVTETPKVEAIDKTEPLPVEKVEVINQEEKPMNTEVSKRFKSLAWRTAVMAVVTLLGFTVDNATALNVPPIAVVFAGLVAGELTKWLNRAK